MENKKDPSTGDRREPFNIAYTELALCRALVNLTPNIRGGPLTIYDHFINANMLGNNR